MLFELALLGYMVAIGFTIAGIAVSGHALVTRGSLRFGEPPVSVLHGLGQTLVLIFGGPLLISNWVMRAWLVERRPAVMAAVGLTVSSFWSFCSGLLLLDIVLSV